MRKKYLIVFFCFIICQTYANEYRQKLDSAWKSEKYSNRLIDELEEKNSKHLEGYLAVAYMMKSNHAVMPWTKLKYFYKGKNLLELAIKDNPKNIEWIYYRYEIQSRIPKGLKYNNLLEDLKKLRHYISDISNKKQDLNLYQQILKLPNIKS